jgi:DNA-binding PadR family transcriptional regulator
MLLERPMYGHQIKETIDVHMEGFSDLKRANLYYLLDRMADQGYLEARMEVVENGDADSAVERKVFYITEAGRQRFRALLRQVLGTVEAMSNPVDVAIFFLPHLPPAEALELLAHRRRLVMDHYERFRANLQAHPELADAVDNDTDHPALSRQSRAHGLAMRDLHAITNDHVESLFKLELEWLDRARARLESAVMLQPA